MKAIILAAFLSDEVPKARVLIANEMVGDRFYDIGEVSIYNNGNILILWPEADPVPILRRGDD